jgi:membrane-bound serine protease (ClpP class)
MKNVIAVRHPSGRRRAIALVPLWLTVVVGLVLLTIVMSATSASASSSAAVTGGNGMGVDGRSADALVGVLTNPVVASALIIVALLLLIADLATGGVGVGSGLAVALFALFFWAHAMAGLASWPEIAVVGVGMVLIALELLVVPGVGLPGLLGLVAILGGLFMAQVGDPVTAAGVRTATISIGAAFVAVVVGLVVTVRLLTRYGAPHALVLDAQLGSGEPVTERATGGWVRWFGGGEELVLDGAGRFATDDFHDRRKYLGGRRGIAVSGLRPSGVAEIDGKRVDVVTAGGYIPAGERIEVVRDDGYRRVVERVSDDADARSE